MNLLIRKQEPTEDFFHHEDVLEDVLVPRCTGMAWGLHREVSGFAVCVPALPISVECTTT